MFSPSRWADIILLRLENGSLNNEAVQSRGPVVTMEYDQLKSWITELVEEIQADAGVHRSVTMQ